MDHESGERLALLDAPAPRRTRTRAIVAVLGVSALCAARIGHGPLSAELRELAPLIEAPSLSFNLTNDYGAAATSLYPWRVVEPFRMTTLVAQGARSGAALHWSVQLGDDELLPDGEGRTRPVAQFLFEHVGREFAISLTERAGSAGSRFASSTVMCKYVRREIRELSDEDRDAYLSALEVVARDAPEALDAARARFGASFSNLDHFVRKHVFAPGCTPYHSGLSFFTSHAAFTLEMDRALQQVRVAPPPARFCSTARQRSGRMTFPSLTRGQIDPRVVTPFWDYTRDDHEFGQHWEDSPLFDEAWFGPANPTNDERALEGRFAGTRVPRGNFTVLNAFGIVTKEINENPSLFATRARQFCGLSISLPLPGCDVLRECLETNSLVDLHSCAEDRLHSNLHNAIGGFWNCERSLGEAAATHPSWHEYLLELGLRSTQVWEHNALLRWPDASSCTPSSSSGVGQACRGMCPSLRDVGDDELDEDTLYTLLAEARLIFFEDPRNRSTCVDLPCARVQRQPNC